MADGDLVETIYGKRHKFEIYKAKRAFGGASFFIHRDGSYWKGNIEIGRAHV